MSEEDILRRLERLEAQVAKRGSYDLAKKGMYLAFAVIWCFGWAIFPRFLQ